MPSPIRDAHVNHIIRIIQEHDCQTANDVLLHMPYWLAPTYINQLASFERRNRDRFGGIINHIKRGSPDPLGIEAFRWSFQPTAGTGAYSTQDQRYNVIAGATSTIRTFCTQADNLQRILSQSSENAILNGMPQLAISYVQLSGAIGLVHSASDDAYQQEQQLVAAGQLP